jgi:replication factor A1
MQTHDIAPHLATLTRALGDKIGTELTEEDLHAELQKYLDYGVPPDQAVRTILRAHGATLAPPKGADAVVLHGRTVLADVPPNAQSVDLLVRIITMNTRTVTARGEEKEILWGIIGDETAALPYTSWRPLEGLEAGAVIEVTGAYTKEYRGEAQINFGDRAHITRKDDDALPTEPAEWKDLNVHDLRIGLRGFRVTGRFLDVSTKEVTVQGQAKTIWTGTFADATGKVEFTSWDDVGFEAGSAVTLQGASVRAFRGQPQLNFDKSATLTPFDGELPSVEELDVAHPMLIAEILASENTADVAVHATLLEVRPGSGLIWRDPETRRSVPSGGNAEPDLRVKFVLDDGTGALTAVVGREETERLLGKDLAACLAEAKEALRTDIIAEQIAAKVAGRVFLAEGFCRTDDYGTMMICRSLREQHENAEVKAQELLGALEA